MISVSIVVPVYNVERYLDRCLQSLVHQSLPDIEIIVVNDGSTDGSGSIARSYALKYSETVRYFEKENGGLSDARNFGFARARGKYIGYIDSDDYVDLDMFEVLYKKAEETGAEIVACGLHHTYSDYEDTEICEHIEEPAELIAYGVSVAWNKLYRLDWLKRISVDFPVGVNHEDIYYFASIVPYLHRIEYVDRPFVHYVQREDSINNCKTDRLGDIHKMLALLEDEYRERGILSDYSEALEALGVRCLLGSSLARFSRVKDRKVRKSLFLDNWRFVTSRYPSRMSNRVLRKRAGLRSLYYRFSNAPAYWLLCLALSMRSAWLGK